MGAYSEEQSSATLVFTKRINLYIDCEMPPERRVKLGGEVLQFGYYLNLQDREYARIRSAAENPLAFISHDSQDKRELVSDLARSLTQLMCPVWYDEYSLKVGDNLRESIERGLKETTRCILVVSPHFLANTGWTKAEFDSVFSREMMEGKNVILPIWHNVTKQQVYEYSPSLVGRFALQSSLGVNEIARQLVAAIRAA